MKKTYAVLALIAVAILVAYALLPDRSFKEDLLPVPEGATLDGYDDRSDGGAGNVVDRYACPFDDFQHTNFGGPLGTAAA